MPRSAETPSHNHGAWQKENEVSPLCGDSRRYPPCSCHSMYSNGTVQRAQQVTSSSSLSGPLSHSSRSSHLNSRHCHAACTQNTHSLAATPRRLAACPAGQYLDNTETCVLCPDGTYNSAGGDTIADCTDCPAESSSSADRTTCECSVSYAVFDSGTTTCRTPRGTAHNHHQHAHA